MKQKSNSLIRIKFNLQGKGAKKEISTFILLGILSFVGLVAPFAHVVYNNSDIAGPLGFNYMSSFLFAIGFPILAVSSGLLFYFVSRKLVGILATAFRNIAFSFTYVGVFFLTWVFIPSIKDFSAAFYYLSIIAIAIVISIVLLLLSRYIFGIVGKVDKLLLLIGIIRNKHFFPMASKALNEENKKTIKEDVDKFDEEVFGTLEEIAK